ncbi:DNA-processing protein DprA [Actinomadura macrotermitis]|uniref:Putative DNA processing protein DprA n=1 Tax=Actinomadura macrotermitis TaxID=2585200 RepID=A0A7K0BQ50_9ACTN|nr:DNA-processing protein DprA [Actinomadura macrotermitis]MQY03012.1 putative DNA processing protein DprA [Actinomadura macrotermitis]
MNDRTARAALTAVAEPGEALLNRIIDRAGPAGALEAIRAARPPEDVITTEHDVPRAVARLQQWRIRLQAVDPGQDLAVAGNLGLRLACPGDPEWPTTLDDLGDERPYALWLRGPEDLRYNCLRSVAIVGARAASPYGLRVAADLGAELAEQGWTVISGGALGIDAAAHRGALAADGPTVAVFANGVDVPYPAGNDGLFAEMARCALLVSESPPGTPPRRSRFLVRNRVIAALSRGTVVVEAAWRSGALSTATWARKLGRDVMAVPGPVGAHTSAGCHRLLREHPPALLVTRSEEVIEAVGRIGADLAPEPHNPVLPRDRLDPVTRTVLETMPARGPAGPAQLAAKAGLDLATVNGKLGLLAAAGFVERTTGGWRLTPAAKARQ